MESHHFVVLLLLDYTCVRVASDYAHCMWLEACLDNNPKAARVCTSIVNFSVDADCKLVHQSN